MLYGQPLAHNLAPLIRGAPVHNLDYSGPGILYTRSWHLKTENETKGIEMRKHALRPGIRMVALVLVFGMVAAACQTAGAEGSTPNTDATTTTSATAAPSTTTPATPTATTGSEPTTTTTPSTTTTVPPTTTTTAPVEVYPGETWDGTGPIFILFIGSDSRDQGGGTCPEANNAGGRADGIHIVAINPVTHAGTIVNIPRDTWATIPGYGKSKINAALDRGGPQLLAQTVANYTGIPIHYTVATTFCGLIKLVDTVGGIWVDVPRTFEDQNAVWGPAGCTSHEIQAGRQLLNGCDILTFSRSRKVMPRGDIDRTTNQGIVLLGLLERFRELSATPDGFWDVLGMWQTITNAKELNDVRALVDFNMNRTELLQLANLAREIDPTALTNVTPPAEIGTVGEASVVFLKGDRVFRDVKDDGLLNGSQ